MKSIALPHPAAENRFVQAANWVKNNLLIVIIAVIVLFLVMIPLVRLVITSFQIGHPVFPEGYTINNFTDALSQPNLYQTLGRTVGIAGTATLISLTIAVLLAWLVERTDMPFRNLAWAMVLIPMAIPGILFALGWTLLLSPKAGALNVFLRGGLDLIGIHLTKGPFNLYSVGGVIFLDGIRGITTIFLMVVGCFRMMDPALEEAARVSRAGGVATFFKVTLPALSPAILAAGMYSFILSMESFEFALAAGLPGGVYVLSTLIYFTTQVQAPLDYGLGAVFGVIFMCIMMCLLVVYRRVVRQADRFSTITGKGFRPRVVSIGKWRYPALGLFIVFFLFSIALPFAILLWTSLMPGYRVPSFDLFHLLSFSNFIEVLADGRVYKVLWNTILVMFATATATMVLAFFVSWIIIRAGGKWKGFLDALVFMPLSVPGVVIALALLMAYLTPPLNSLGIYGTVWILVLGLMVIYLPFSTRLMNGAIVQLHKELEEAAHVSGATRFRTLLYVTLPLLFPAFAAGWVWVAVHALRAFPIPLMLAGRNNMVFSVLLWESWEEATAQAAAMGVILIIVLFPMTLLMRRFITQISGQQS